MESSKDECNSSSESGWTMYLCSPKNSDQSNVYDDGIHIDVYKNKGFELENDDDSDDSMASDASSGPIRWGNGQNGHDLFGNKAQEEDKRSGKSFSNKKSKYQEQEKEGSVLIAKGAEGSLKFNGKVRKNSWFGKRK